MTLETLQKEIHEWSSKTFPINDASSKYEHLIREVKELGEDTSKGEELADCLILLAGIAELHGVDLMAEAIKKMEINKQRKWGEADEFGVYSHLPEFNPPAPVIAHSLRQLDAFRRSNRIPHNYLSNIRTYSDLFRFGSGTTPLILLPAWDEGDAHEAWIFVAEWKERCGHIVDISEDVVLGREPLPACLKSFSVGSASTQ